MAVASNYIQITKSYLKVYSLHRESNNLTDDLAMYVFVSSIPKTMIMVGRHQFDTSCFLSNASWWLERNNNLTKTLIKFDQATKNTFRRFYPWIKRDDNTKDFFSSSGDIFSTPLKRTRWQFAARRNAHQSSLETAHNLFC